MQPAQQGVAELGHELLLAHRAGALVADLLRRHLRSWGVSKSVCRGEGAQDLQGTYREKPCGCPALASSRTHQTAAGSCELRPAHRPRSAEPAEKPPNPLKNGRVVHGEVPDLRSPPGASTLYLEPE
eukprot:gene15196-biopygen20165